VNSLRRPLFPLVRHLSLRTTPWLIATPLTPNQITTLSLVSGLGASVCVLLGSREANIWAGILMLICYVLDNCDGEVARIKGLSSPFGAKYDTFVDWLIHASFFAALGVGLMDQLGDYPVLWLGVIAAVGASVNYVVGLFLDAVSSENPHERADQLQTPETLPPRWLDMFILFFRELSRADFCFIVLVLAIFDLLWPLLPLAAVGSQVYWITQFVRGARRHHV
jgi:phosphatidylglycerophosphate synthase